LIDILCFLQRKWSGAQRQRQSADERFIGINLCFIGTISRFIGTISNFIGMFHRFIGIFYQATLSDRTEAKFNIKKAQEINFRNVDFSRFLKF